MGPVFSDLTMVSVNTYFFLEAAQDMDGVSGKRVKR
jgi:hypothetical protein